MSAALSPHVDACGDHAGERDGRIAHGLGWSGEREDGAMGVDARVDVQQLDPGDRPHCCSEGRDHVRIAALGDVRDALDQRAVRHACA